MNTTRRGFLGMLGISTSAVALAPALAKMPLPDLPVPVTSPRSFGIFSTYSAIGTRENLMDCIYNIDPTDTPFMQMADLQKSDFGDAQVMPNRLTARKKQKAAG